MEANTLFKMSPLTTFVSSKTKCIFKMATNLTLFK